MGFGYDSHRLVEGRRLVLGGVDIPHAKGLAGHSDADVLTHAVIDSVIGALGLGDIGAHFPDTDPKYKDASSLFLLAHVIGLASQNGYRVSWVDATILAEAPRLAPFMEAMKAALAGAGLRPGSVNIKAKTNEGMGLVGAGEGMAAYAVCLIEKL